MKQSYQPTSRRPIAEMFRRTAHHSVSLCVRLHVHPDVISYASVLASMAAGACFLFSARVWSLLIVGPMFCLLRLWCNMLDGMVAIASAKATRRGEILNDLPDRISDVIIFAAVVESGLCQPRLGYFAAISALLTAYVGMLSQAVGARRQFQGWMSKPWRMVAVLIGSWVLWVMLRLGPGLLPPRWTPLDLACAIVILGCIQTVIVRLRATMAELNDT